MDYARPYAFDLTDSQYGMLRGLVDAASALEEERGKRMAARPPGTHSARIMRDAAQNRATLQELRAILADGPITEPAA